MTRFGLVMVTYFTTALIGALQFFHTAPQLIWNATASTPIGLYGIRPAGVLHINELVAAMPPEPVASFLTDHGFLPKGVPLLKHVMALPGQTICRIGAAVSIDGNVIGEALARDSRGRTLPVWSGCRTITADEIFLMNRTVPDSLDGRYFGPFPTHSIIGQAIPLWTDEDNDGDFAWHAPEH